MYVRAYEGDGRIRRNFAPATSSFLYTDGVTEAEDPETLQFGEERLEGLARGRKGRARARPNGLPASRPRCETLLVVGPNSTTSPVSALRR